MSINSVVVLTMMGLPGRLWVAKPNVAPASFLGDSETLPRSGPSQSGDDAVVASGTMSKTSGIGANWSSGVSTGRRTGRPQSGGWILSSLRPFEESCAEELFS